MMPSMRCLGRRRCGGVGQGSSGFMEEEAYIRHHPGIKQTTTATDSSMFMQQ